MQLHLKAHLTNHPTNKYFWIFRNTPDQLTVTLQSHVPSALLAEVLDYLGEASPAFSAKTILRSVIANPSDVEYSSSPAPTPAPPSLAPGPAAMEAPQQMYGVTPPMKLDLPTDAESRSTDALLEELKKQGTFESPADTAKRYGYPLPNTRR